MWCNLVAYCIWIAGELFESDIREIFGKVCRVAKATDCKFVTLETSWVQLLPFPPILFESRLKAGPNFLAVIMVVRSHPLDPIYIKNCPSNSMTS